MTAPSGYRDPLEAKTERFQQALQRLTCVLETALNAAYFRRQPVSCDPRHHRRSIRLPGYDYTRAGAYFVTLVVHDRACLFGDVVDGGMRLNAAGRVAEQCWSDIPSHFPHVALDAFVIMPNHVHGILWIVATDGETTMVMVGAKNFSPPPPPANQTPRGTSKTIGSVVRGFKIGVTKWFRQHTTIETVWQRNYYEHIIRDDDALARIRAYIQSNPQRWAEDQENPYRRGDRLVLN